MTFNRDSLPPLRDVIAHHNLRAEKKLGQNFLLDPNVTDKIVRCAGDIQNVNIVEIGPGPGGLTRSLLCSDAANVNAIEFDPRAIIALQDLQTAAGARLNLIQGDALSIDLRQITSTPRAIVANLPYNIATPLLIGWLRHIAADPHTYRSMTLMFQKEVADRIIAAPGNKAYGRLSILCQWLCNVQQSYILPAEAFTPPPKVKSAIVHFKPRIIDDAQNQPDFSKVEAITEAAFGQRRKMIRSSLKTYIPAIEQIGLDLELRAENLSVADYINLARVI